MQTLVKINSIFNNNNHQMLLLENLNTYQLDLDMNKNYEIEIREKKTKRSLNQNRLMWKLLNEIGKRLGQEDMEVYCQALQDCQVKYVEFVGIDGMKEELLKNFRAVCIHRSFTKDNIKYFVYRCFTGSSKLNVKEMNQLLEKIIDWAELVGINTDYYAEMYK